MCPHVSHFWPHWSDHTYHVCTGLVEVVFMIRALSHAFHFLVGLRYTLLTWSRMYLIKIIPFCENRGRTRLELNYHLWTGLPIKSYPIILPINAHGHGSFFFFPGFLFHSDTDLLLLLLFFWVKVNPLNLLKLKTFYPENTVDENKS